MCVVVLLLAELLLCPADCLQAEWAQRMSRSLATCEHSPSTDLTVNSFEDRGKGDAEKDIMKTVRGRRSVALMHNTDTVCER